MVSAKRACILIAEDDPAIRWVYEQVVGSLGHEARAAENGALAWREWKARPSRIALVITDRNMPDACGFWLARQVRAEPEGGRVVILMITGDARAAAQADVEGLIDEILEKPIRAQELREKVSALLRTGRSK